MIPLALLGLFAKDAILSLLIKKQSGDNEKMVELADVEENEETEEKKSLREKLAAVQDAMSMVQKLLGINKFTKKLRNPMADQNNELLDFLSRVPTANELAMYMNEAVNESRINQKAELKVAVTNNNNNNGNKKIDVKRI
ncbi:conserved hypothetical protein [Trichinella spiralis]|nr:conserved hypothetical protein [Trichinella spiralis]